MNTNQAKSAETIKHVQFYIVTAIVILSAIVVLTLVFIPDSIINGQDGIKRSYFKDDDPRTDEELLKTFGNDFDVEAYRRYFFKPMPLPDTPDLIDSATAVVEAFTLRYRLRSAQDISRATELLRKAFESGNWQEFGVMSEIAGRSVPAEEHIILILRMYHNEENSEKRQAILVALKWYVQCMSTKAPLTKRVLGYMATAPQIETSVECLAQWARIYAEVLELKVFKKDEYLNFGRPVSDLYFKFERERRVRKNLPIPDERDDPSMPVSEWWILKYPIFPQDDGD